MDIYSRIKEDHNKHRDLIEKILKTSGDSAERHRLFDMLKNDVTAHANAEEQTFYASLIKEPETQEKTRHSIHEHEQADELFEELSELSMASGGWLAKFKKLADELEHHMDEEEEEVFPRAKQVISKDKAKALAMQFDSRKQAERKAA